MRTHGSSKRKCVFRKEAGLVDILVTLRMFFQYNERNLHTDKHVRGISWTLVTYVCVGPLICPWAGERDKFMAPLVDHKTANCRGRKETRRWCLERARERDSERKKYRDRWRKE